MITDDYIDFIEREGLALFHTTVENIGHVISDLTPRIRTADGGYAERLSDVDAASPRLLAWAERICRGHDSARLLLLFRRTPVAVAVNLLGGRDRADPMTVANVFTEGMLCGTNCILSFARQQQPIALGEREFQPTNDEMADAIRLAIVIFAHRLNIFHANDLARRHLTSGVSHDELIASYNRRQYWSHTVRVAKEAPAMVGPSLSMNFRRETLDRRVSGGEDGEREVFLRTWVPASMPIANVQAAYGYLAEKQGFAARLGRPYDIWLQAWTAMNRVLDSQLRQSLQHLSEYGASGMTGWHAESLIDSAHGVATQMFESPPSLDDCRAVFASLTYPGHCEDVPFPEQPFVFYRYEGGLTLWDGLRHRGMLRSVARTLTRGGGNTRLHGRALETQIACAVKDRFGVAPMVRVKLKEDRQDVGDLDLVFACRGVLFAVEAKNELHNLDYFFEGGKVVHRVRRLREYRDDHDHFLREQRASIRVRVPSANDTVGMIGIVCTRETEFIPSFSRDWWLLSDTCPRVCRLDELLDALPQVAAHELATHPSFVPWDSAIP